MPERVLIAAFLFASLLPAQLTCDWQTVGAASFASSVEDLIRFDDGTGEALYAVGRFPEICARWDGTSWQTVGVPLSGYALCATVHDDGTGDALYISGCLSQPMPGATERVFKLVGNAWQPVTGWNVPSFGSCVLCLDEFEVGGVTRLCAGTNAFGNGLVYRSGSSWVGVPVGANVLQMEPFDDGSGSALFLATSPGGMQRWNGTSISGAGTLFGARELKVLDLGSGPRLLAGTDGVYEWSGSSWSVVGGFQGNSVTVRALQTFDAGAGAKLFAGGTFSFVAGNSYSHVACWDGTTWTPVGAGVSGGGLPRVLDLVPFDDGGGEKLYAGGTFLQAGSVPAMRVASWSCEPAPSFSSTAPCGQVLPASVGVPVAFPVSATANIGSTADSLTLQVAGLPAGATQIPPLPQTAAGTFATVASMFSWTPSAAQVGTHQITYTATDQLGATTQCSVTVVVAECYLLLGDRATRHPVGPLGDTLLVVPMDYVPVTTTAVPSYPIPNVAALAGQSVFAQIAMYNPYSFPADPLQLTQGLEVVLGGGCREYGDGGSPMKIWSPVAPVLGGNLTFAFQLQ
jgi:hypothetical protein